MPIVHFEYETHAGFLNPAHEVFKKNLFVALRRTSQLNNGTLVHEFEEFVPCHTLSDSPDYLDVSYSGENEDETTVS